jgi:hypothetical protein
MTRCLWTGNNMARCVSFPTVVKQGLLFVWPDENGHELAEKTSPPITPGKAVIIGFVSHRLYIACGPIVSTSNSTDLLDCWIVSGINSCH